MKANAFPHSSTFKESLQNCGIYSLYHPNYHFHTIDYITQNNIMGSKAWLQEGWVKYHEGEQQHQFWLHLSGDKIG